MKGYSLRGLLRIDFMRAVSLTRLKLRHPGDLGDNNTSVPTSYIVSVPLARPRRAGLAARASALGCRRAGWSAIAAALAAVARAQRRVPRRDPAQRRLVAGRWRPCPLLWLELLVVGVGTAVGLAHATRSAGDTERLSAKEITRWATWTTCSTGRRCSRKKGELPVYLVYFITDACNAKCKHCLLADGAHPGWEEPSMAYRKQELSLEELDKITAQHGQGSLMFLLPTGGEPFLRKDIGEIVKIFHKNTGVRNVGIPTNGSTTARTLKIVEDLCESCPDLDLHIDVSLDGVGALHDEIRVFPGLFKRSIETYKALRELEKHYKNFSVQVETTVSKHNEDVPASRTTSGSAGTSTSTPSSRC